LITRFVLWISAILSPLSPQGLKLRGQPQAPVYAVSPLSPLSPHKNTRGGSKKRKIAPFVPPLWVRSLAPCLVLTRPDRCGLPVRCLPAQAKPSPFPGAGGPVAPARAHLGGPSPKFDRNPGKSIVSPDLCERKFWNFFSGCAAITRPMPPGKTSPPGKANPAARLPQPVPT